MVFDPLRVVEDVIDLDIDACLRSDSFGERIRERHRKRLTDSVLAKLRERLDEGHAAEGSPSYGESEVAVRVFPTEYGSAATMIIGPRPFRTISPNDVVRHLLVSHKVEAVDPMHARLLLPGGSINGARNWFFKEIHTLATLRPFIRSGALVLVPAQPAGRDCRDPIEEISEALDDRRVRAALVEAMPWLREIPFRGPSADVVGPVNQSPYRNAIRAEAIRSTIAADILCGGDSLLLARDFERILPELIDTSADVMLPRREHFNVIRTWSLVDPSVDEAGFVRMGAAEVAPAPTLRLDDLVSLRQSSDAFNHWRQGLGESVKAVNRALARGADTAAAQVMGQEVLDKAAADFGVSIKREGKLIAGVAANSFLVGCIGAAPGVVAGGGADVAALGALAGALGGTVWSVPRLARRISAVQAARRLFACIDLDQDD